MKGRLVVTVLLLVLSAQTDIITTEVTISNNLTLASSVTYTVKLSMNTLINSGSTLQLWFSTFFNITTNTLNNCQATISSVVPLSSAACYATNSSTLYYINFDSLFPVTATITDITLSFVINNPIGSGSEPFDIYIFSSGTALAHGNPIISYDPSPLGNCQLTSNSDVVGVAAVQSASFVPSQMIVAGSTVSVTLPSWGSISNTNFVGTIGCTPVTNAGTSITCTTSYTGTSPRPITSQTITANGMFPSTLSGSSTVAFSVSNIRNPPSTQAYGPTAYTITYNGRVSQSCSSIYVKVGTPGVLSITGWTNSTLNRSISAVNTVTKLSLRATSSFPSSGYVLLTFPSGMVTYTGSLTSNYITSTSVSLTGFQSTNVLIGSTMTTIVSYTIVYPTSTRPININVSTLTNSSGTVYYIDSVLRTFTATAGTITSASASQANTSVNAVTTSTVIFTIANNLVAGSFITIQFPAELTLQDTTCSSTASSSSCTVSSPNATITLSGALSGGSTITLTVPNVKNPYSTQTTSSFQIISYYDSLFDSLVDSVTTGITVSSVANQLTVASVTPTSVQVIANTTYTFSITLRDAITQGGFFDLVFPAEVTFASPSLTILSASLEGTCTPSYNSKTIRFSNCFSTANRSTSTPLSFSLNPITNPSSFATSSAFFIYTYDSALRMINYQNSSLSTLTVTMTQEAPLTATITPTTTTVHQTTSYTFAITFSVGHVTGDILVITFPTGITPPASPGCSPLTGLSSASCTTSGSAVTLTMSYSSFPANYSISFSIASVKNYDIAKTLNFAIQSLSSASSPIEKVSAVPVTFTETTLSSVTVNSDQNIAVLTASNVSLTITTPFTVDSSLSAASTSILITIPTGFTIGSTCTATAGTCSASSSTTYTVSSPGLTVSDLVVVLQNITLPYFSSTSSSFTVRYMYSTDGIATTSSGIVVTVYCTSPCKQCSGSKTACVSCLPAPNTLISYDADTSSCLAVCPDGKYNDASNICQKCVSPCNKCSSASSCISCVTGTWLSGTSCVTTCPSQTYNDSSGVCSACVSPCNTCTTISACTTCSTGYLTGTSCVNANSCPAGTYPEASNLTCSVCTSPCQNCNTTATNCTSCVNPYLYYSNLCVLTCPSGMYPSSGLCLTCVSPCATCTSSTACLTCSTGYLTGTNCVTASNCPAGTYPEAFNLTCSNCTSPCQNCNTTATNCTSCVSPYLYYSNLCVLSCPSGRYPSSGLCLACVSPCSTCTSSTACTTCSTGYLTGTSCVNANSCPAGTYPESSNLTCSACTSPCQNCDTVSTNCTSCVSPYLYYSNLCVITCPSGRYASSGLCLTCVSPCATCTSSTACLTCSTGYLSGTSCVSSTSCPAGTYPEASNMTCSSCTSPCQNCNTTGTNCTSCVNPYFYYSNQCVASCPVRMYPSSGLCLACVSPCDTCTSSSACSSCLSGFFLTGTNCVTSSNCPAGTYPEGSNLTCTACSSPCQNCNSTGTNCTSCVASYLYYSNNCVLSCPSGMYPSSPYCLSCVSPCATCTGASSCLSCGAANTYLSGTSCVTTCPSGTYANSSTVKCEPCTSPCQTCSPAATSCTSCIASYFFYNGACSLSCPTKTYASGSNCLDCVSPCDTCTSATACSSCLTGFLSGTSCVTSCPTGTYASSGTCTTCPVNCTACSSATSCSSCSTGYYFLANQCLSVCPTGTYSNGTHCLTCSSTCQSCTGSSANCTGCASPAILYNSSCYTTCPTGTYQTTTACIDCNVSCSSCTSATSCNGCKTSYYLLNSICYSVCPDGYYGSGTNCIACTPPCSTCATTGSNCLSCSSGNLYQATCITSCPSFTAPLNNVCVDCGNCVKCIDATSCQTCKAGYYAYNNQCYTSCPSQAPITEANMTCSPCDSTCLTCDLFTYNCTSCFNGRFLFRYECVVNCPSGMIGVASTRVCIEPIIGRIVFFPASLFALSVCLVFLYSKYAFKATEMITAAAAVLSLAEFFSWNVLTYVLLYDYELDNKMTFFGVGLAVIITSMVASVAFTAKVWASFCREDIGFRLWEDNGVSCKVAKYAVNTLSCFVFRFFRIIYSRLFGRVWLNCFFSKGTELLILTRSCTYASVALNSFPMVAMAGTLVYFKRIKDQTYYNCIDVAVIGACSIILNIINCQKNLDHFEETREQLGIRQDYENVLSQDTSSINAEAEKTLRRKDPNRKYRNSWEECIEENRRRCKTGCFSSAEADKLFRGIKFADPNKFGHLNVLEDPPEDKERSLPEYGELFKLGQDSDQNRKEAQRERKRKLLEERDKVVVDEDAEELEKERREQQLREQIKREDEERMRKVQQQIQREIEEEKERQLKLEEQRERLRKEEEDALEQVDITFQDKMLITKELDKNIGKKKEESPVDRLKKFKSTQDRNIDDKEMKKLEEMAVNKGLNPEFVKKVLGKEKSYNPELLKALMGKYSHFPKELLQRMFDPNNSPEVLQTLLGKDSTIDPEKLKEYFGGENGEVDEVLFHRLFGKEGLQSPELVKQIFDRNSKVTPEFVENLLGRNSPVSDDKLNQLFEKDNTPDLKHLRKLFGEHAENSEAINKMLGEESALDVGSFKRITNDIKPEVLNEILKLDPEHANLLFEKLLNDPSVDLKAVNRMLKDPEAIATMSKVLEQGGEQALENLRRFIRDSPNMDPKLVEQFLSKPELVTKLLGSCDLDPQFLKAMLGKDSRVDLGMFEGVVAATSAEALKEMFEFSPEKHNIDFQAVATLFEKDRHTDANLIQKMFENPKLFSDLYTKGNNDPQVLKKLVEKGREFNPELVQKLYGKDKNPFLAANYNFELERKDKSDDDQDFHSMKGDGRPRIAQEISNMSRTEGLNFLKPRTFLNVNHIVEMGSEVNLLQHDQLNNREGSESEDDGEEVTGGPRRKKKLPKLKPKKRSDIRLDAEKIYLQRLEAPAEKQLRQIRKKKKKRPTKGVMDEDNDEFDLDF